MSASMAERMKNKSHLQSLQGKESSLIDGWSVGHAEQNRRLSWALTTENWNKKEESSVLSLSTFTHGCLWFMSIRNNYLGLPNSFHTNLLDPSSNIKPAARNPVLIFDSDLSFEEQIPVIVKSCFCQLRSITEIRFSLGLISRRSSMPLFSLT